MKQFFTAVVCIAWCVAALAQANSSTPPPQNAAENKPPSANAPSSTTPPVTSQPGGAAPTASNSASGTTKTAATPEAPKYDPADVANYVIGPADVLAINVWKEPDLTKTVPVRPDGHITLPLVGDLMASGLTPVQLQHNLQAKLKDKLIDPEVTVTVEQFNSHKFNIVGEVGHPGAYDLLRPITVLDALALAGGFRDFAKTKGIYVLRKQADGTQTKLKFNYNDVIKGKHAEQNMAVQAGDTIVVP
jgi:polysaccharide export outer membrane protein